MKEDLIQIRSSLVIKPHTVLGDLLRIDEWIHKQRMPVNSVLFTDKGRNDCPQLVSICFGLHNELCMVWAVVLEDETMTQVQCCCLSCALSSSHILLHDSFLPWQDSQFQTHWSTLQHDVFDCRDGVHWGVWSLWPERSDFIESGRRAYLQHAPFFSGFSFDDFSLAFSWSAVLYWFQAWRSHSLESWQLSRGLENIFYWFPFQSLWNGSPPRLLCFICALCGSPWVSRSYFLCQFWNPVITLCSHLLLCGHQPFFSSSLSFHFGVMFDDSSPR